MKGYARRLMGRMIISAVMVLSASAAIAAEAEPFTEAAYQITAVQEEPISSRPIRWDGPWDQTTPYRKDDTVVYNGNVFVAIQDNFMEKPGADTTFWRQLPGKPHPSTVG